LILYEYPFNERIRTLLRLEDLFERLDFFLAQEHPLQHHVALTTLFEIVDVTCSRSWTASARRSLRCAPTRRSTRTRSTPSSASWKRLRATSPPRMARPAS
jgi:hypothetical protein